MSFERAGQNTLPEEDHKEGSFEKEPGFNFEFYITDHSADHPDTGSPEKLRELYADIKRDGVESVRYDWHWRNVEPESGKYSEEHLERYKQAKDIMHEVGLEAPTIILSNPPKWAVELYKTDKEKFYEEFKKYAEQVRNSLEQAEGEKVSTIQILNELNNGVYTPVAAHDLPRMCEITRDVFHDYNPDIKLMATLLASNTTRFVGTPIQKYLPEFEKIRDNFDVIAVDYYPGLWHLDPRGAKSWSPKEIFKRMVTQMDLLRETFEEIASWGVEYELGEVGIPTNRPWGDEKSQRYFYDAFFRAYKHMMVDFRSRGLPLPSRIGFYEAIDEAPRTRLGKILRKTPFPEHDMGVRETSGKRKLVLRGSPHLSEEERSQKSSQLSKIISYLRAPMRHTENQETKDKEPDLELKEFLKEFDFETLRAILQELKEAAGSKEPIAVTLPDNIHSGKSIMNRGSAEYHWTNQSIRFSYRDIEHTAEMMGVDPRLVATELLIHEEIHAATDQEFGQVGYRGGDYTRQNLFLGRQSFKLWNEGVTEKLAQEVFVEYARRTGTTGNADAEKFLQILKKSRVGSLRSSYEKAIDLVNVLGARVGKAAGVPHDVVWKAITRGLFEGQSLTEEDFVEFVKDILPPNFFDDLARANSMTVMRLVRELEHGESAQKFMTSKIVRKLLRGFDSIAEVGSLR